MAKKWDWPLKGLTAFKKTKASFLNDQLFGARGTNFRPNGFHDGLDFGSNDHTGNPPNKIYGAHSGKVIAVGYRSGNEWYVITKDNAGIYVIYQEFASSKSDIAVSVGQTVHIGTFIGTRTGTHLHIGINTKKNPLDANAWTMDGWVDPLETIIEDKLGSNDDGTGGDDNGDNESKGKDFVMLNTYWRY